MILKIYNWLRNIFFSLFIIVSFYSFKFYEGSLVVYGTYCMSLILTLFYLTKKRATYFEIFFSVYLFLGFWFKYVFSLILYNGLVYDSGLESAKNIDNILILGTLISLSCLFSHFIFRKLKKKFLLPKSFNFKNSIFENFYLSHRFKTIFIFLLIIILFSYLNLKFGIYQRGFIHVNEISELSINIIKWFLLFGLTTFSCFIIHIEITKQKKINIFTILVAIFEIFTSYTSMLSRSFIINTSSILLPAYRQSLNFTKKYDLKFICISILVILLTLISIFEVNKIRLQKMEIVHAEHQKKIQNTLSASDENHKNSSELNQTQNGKFKKETSGDMTNFILVNRWVGIESLILVSNSKSKSFKTFFKSFEETKNNKENTFYEKVFGLLVVKTNNITTDKIFLKGNTLPGIISFLYYTGSIPFVLISLIFIFLFFNLLENLIKYYTFSNVVYSCFISNMIATRLFHFGYAPKDSYLFFGSVFLSFIFLLFLQRFNFRIFK